MLKKHKQKLKYFKPLEDKVPLRIGYDLDGVLAHPTMKRSKFKMFKFYRTCIPLRVDKFQEEQITNEILVRHGTLTETQKQQITFEIEASCKHYIITGRKHRYRNVTTEWLESSKINYRKVYFFKGKDKTINSLAKHKAKIIKKKKINIFWEDTEVIAWLLAFKCPKCEIRWFDPETYTYTIINVKDREFKIYCKCGCGERIKLNQPLREIKKLGFINGHYNKEYRLRHGL